MGNPCLVHPLHSTQQSDERIADWIALLGKDRLRCASSIELDCGIAREWSGDVDRLVMHAEFEYCGG